MTDEREDEPGGGTELVLYEIKDHRTRIDVRLQNGTVWATQGQLAELFLTSPQNITIHLKGIYEDGELTGLATCKDYLQVRREGGRQVTRSLKHYNLEAILAVGYRVRSPRGTQFRQWATARLNEYLVKGFTLDDERLANPPGPAVRDYCRQVFMRDWESRVDDFLRFNDRSVRRVPARYLARRPMIELAIPTIGTPSVAGARETTRSESND